MNTAELARRYPDALGHRGDNHGPALADQPVSDKIGMTLYLPLKDNAGHTFSSDQLRGAVAKIIRHFGGATVFPASSGYWVSPEGQAYEDRVSAILVVAPNTVTHVQTFRLLVEQFAQEFQQHEIFMYMTPVSQMIDPLSPRTQFSGNGLKRQDIFHW